MGDFSFFWNSSILNSVIFDQPSSAGRQEAHTFDPLLESMVSSSCNYHTTIDYCDNILPSLSSNSCFNVFCLNVRGIKQFVVTNCSKERPGSIVTKTLKNGILIPIAISKESHFNAGFKYISFIKFSPTYQKLRA